MACRYMIFADWGELRLALCAHRRRKRTAGAEAAAGRQVASIRRLALEHERVSDTLATDARNRGEKRSRVRVPRRSEKPDRRSDLDDAAEVHHGDAVAHDAHHGEIVRDEYVGEVERTLELAQQLQHGRLHRDIEAGRRLVEDYQPRLQRENAGESDAALLATR